MYTSGVYTYGMYIMVYIHLVCIRMVCIRICIRRYVYIWYIYVWYVYVCLCIRLVCICVWYVYRYDKMTSVMRNGRSSAGGMRPVQVDVRSPQETGWTRTKTSTQTVSDENIINIYPTDHVNKTFAHSIDVQHFSLKINIWVHGPVKAGYV